MASFSSKVRNSSPSGYRKPYSPFSSSSSSSSSSLINGRHIQRYSSSSVSSFYGSGNGLSARSKTPSRGRSDSVYYGTPTPVDFASADEHIGEQVDVPRSGDSISVTIRFRPLRASLRFQAVETFDFVVCGCSEREFHRGDEIAWYADGDKIVRNEYNPATAYAFDRVFGPSTNSKAVYDVAARPVVKAAMEGVNGMVVS
ncbi:hypothetical protein HHK36_003047 [Tetracentron sinense]|uniref:Kinesin motor domain-containing protein n=1 Tax=Tetracentron sinense TaxID=13715 RepID=A0A834ZNL4_TETSI|nr:hypothetical protein HHK36_003047 [Tetracentron sinense]